MLGFSLLPAVVMIADAVQSVWHAPGQQPLPGLGVGHGSVRGQRRHAGAHGPPFGGRQGHGQRAT